MNTFLVRNGERLPLSTPFEGADHAVVDGAKCPHCADAPFKIAGSGMRIASDDRSYEAAGYCLACKKPVGTIRAEPDTLFGLHEDEAVLVHGRCRVY